MTRRTVAAWAGPTGLAVEPVTATQLGELRRSGHLRAVRRVRSRQTT